MRSIPFQALQGLYNLDANIRVATALVLLEIARQTPKGGCTVRHLCKELHMTQPAVSRAVLRLGTRGSNSSHEVGEPLGLISAVMDPEETRRHLLALNTKGKSFLAEVGINT